MLRKFVLLVIGATLLFGGVARAQTNYPAGATLEIRDENGQLLTSGGVKVDDPLNVFASGWAANVDIQATWFSDPIDLGKHKSDSKGELRFTFDTPDAPPVPGVHTLRLEGTGANGEFRRVDAAIRVEPRDGTGTTSTTVAGGNGNGNGNNGNGNGNGGGNGSNGNGGGNGNGSSVLGRTQTNGNVSGNNGNLAFGKTGAELANMAKVGFTLMAVGAVLFLAVRKRTAATA